MPQKKKHKRQWIFCEECGIFVLNVALEQHSLCHDSLLNISHISGSEVFLEIVSAIPEKNLPSSLQNDVVQLNPETMRICRMHVGSEVVLSNSVVTTAWPVPSLPVDSVGLPSRLCEVLAVGSGQLCQVSKLPFVRIADRLVLDHQREFVATSHFEEYLRHVIDHRVYKVGSAFDVVYFGRCWTFTVLQVDTDRHDVAGVFDDTAVDGSYDLGNCLTDVSEKMTELCLYNNKSSTPLKVPDSLTRSCPGGPQGDGQISSPDNASTKIPSELTNSSCCDGDADGESACDAVGTMSRNNSSFENLGRNQFFRITPQTAVTFRPLWESEGGTALATLPLSSKIGGLKPQLDTLRRLILEPLQAPGRFSALRLTPARGVLLYGCPGVGKTLLMDAICEEAPCPVYRLNLADIFTKLFFEAETYLRRLFKTASTSPSIILIDDLHVICPKNLGGQTEVERKVPLVLTTLIDSLSLTTHVILLAATNSLDSIHISLRRPGRFDHEVEVPIPSLDSRISILQVCLEQSADCVAGDAHSKLAHSEIVGEGTCKRVSTDVDLVDSKHEVDPETVDCNHVPILEQNYSQFIDLNANISLEELKSVAVKLHGYVGADIRVLIQTAKWEAFRRSRSRITLDDLTAAMTAVRPTAMKELYIDVPMVKWGDIGGEGDLKHKLKQTVEWPLTHPEAFSKLGISPPRGVLLYGPAGCSKTLMAKALATESGLNFISVKGPELFDKYVGESERAVRELFRKARCAAPSIIFFDEIDALATVRGGGSMTVGDRVLATLLTEMDGVQELVGVTVVAATNRPDVLDPALMRPGRLDRLIYVPLPDLATRTAIFALQFRKVPVGADVKPACLAAMTVGYSGAELVALCSEAALAALDVDLDASTVSVENFDTALEMVLPRTNPELIRKYEQFSVLSR